MFYFVSEVEDINQIEIYISPMEQKEIETWHAPSGIVLVTESEENAHSFSASGNISDCSTVLIEDVLQIIVT